MTRGKINRAECEQAHTKMSVRTIMTFGNWVPFANGGEFFGYASMF
jgi:hypothetical protein